MKKVFNEDHSLSFEIAKKQQLSNEEAEPLLSHPQGLIVMDNMAYQKEMTASLKFSTQGIKTQRSSERATEIEKYLHHIKRVLFRPSQAKLSFMLDDLLQLFSDRLFPKALDYSRFFHSLFHLTNVLLFKKEKNYHHQAELCKECLRYPLFSNHVDSCLFDETSRQSIFKMANQLDDVLQALIEEKLADQDLFAQQYKYLLRRISILLRDTSVQYDDFPEIQQFYLYCLNYLKKQQGLTPDEMLVIFLSDAVYKGKEVDVTYLHDLDSKWDFESVDYPISIRRYLYHMILDGTHNPSVPHYRHHDQVYMDTIYSLIDKNAPEKRDSLKKEFKRIMIQGQIPKRQKFITELSFILDMDKDNVHVFLKDVFGETHYAVTLLEETAMILLEHHVSSKTALPLIHALKKGLDMDEWMCQLNEDTKKELMFLNSQLARQQKEAAIAERNKQFNAPLLQFVKKICTESGKKRTLEELLIQIQLEDDSHQLNEKVDARIREHRLNPARFAKLKNCTEIVEKKDVIHACFYYALVHHLSFNGFVSLTNQMLTSFNWGPLNWAYPFDQFILTCMISGKPAEFYRKVIFPSAVIQKKTEFMNAR